MLIGIDASRALSSAPTGTEYYSRALIGALLEQASPGLRFRLYTRHASPVGAFPSTRNYEARAIPFPRLWTHARLSWEMLTRPPAALFVPAHVLPPIHPRNSVVTVHDLGYKYFPDAHPVFERLYLDLSTRWNVRAARAVIADSNATRTDLIRGYGAPPDRIQVVYPGYDSARFAPLASGQVGRVRRAYDLTGPYLLSVGTVQPRKNYARLLEAVAGLSGWTLVIVGKLGWRTGQLTSSFIGHNVRWLDYVPPEDLPGLYAGAELVVLPSLYEGFGLPVLEAQACGAPLACSDTSSLPEVAGAGATYFDPLDVKEMRQVLVRALDDDALRQSLRARGFENVRRFAWPSAARQTLEIITQGTSGRTGERTS